MPEAPGVDLPGASRLFGYRLRGPFRNLLRCRRSSSRSTTLAIRRSIDAGAATWLVDGSAACRHWKPRCRRPRQLNPKTRVRGTRSALGCR
jgi:hypothetical protein